MRLAAIGLAWLVLVGMSAWAIAALYIDLPASWSTAAAVSYAALLVCTLFACRSPLLRMSVWLASFAVVLIWWLSLSPSNSRQWQMDVDRTAWADISGDIVTIHNVRNFDYRTEMDYRPRWETRRYDLSQIQGVDIFITFWGSPWIAHPIVSFQFSDGQHIAFSVETRKVIGQKYSAILGFFRQYELIYTVADERDVIRLRTNYRKDEEVYLYRTTATPEAARSIFIDYLHSLNRLHQRAQYYNAITSNCTTNIRIHTSAASGKMPPWDWRLLLNGKGDEYAYQHGRLAGALPFDELKARAHINDAARAAGQAPDFSARIRAGRAGFR
ncbi:DUF4105 domain-containing protein [Dongia sp.]|jgi:hypothetical protein|uniref:Lnb N-terminal periplasmic domain-containing protein n=1 Tax=Dongia sp. TaxID=1977262 RepID=UPI0035B3CE1B